MATARETAPAPVAAAAAGAASAGAPSPSSPPTPLAATLTEMVREGGVLSLWAGLGPLLLREMLFSLPKFLVFQSGSAFLLARFPGIADTPTNADDLLVSLVAGAAAGVAGAIVS